MVLNFFLCLQTLSEEDFLKSANFFQIFVEFFLAYHNLKIYLKISFSGRLKDGKFLNPSKFLHHFFLNLLNILTPDVFLCGSSLLDSLN